MTKLKRALNGPYPLFGNSLCALFLIIAIIFTVSPASAVDFDVKGTNVGLYGYAKLMMIYDTDGTVKGGPYKGDLIDAYDAPLDGTALADDDDFRMTARESRIGVKTKTDTEYGILQTLIEADFYGQSNMATSTWSNSDVFRIRHAYGSLARGSHELLAGQTWSTFMDLAAGVPQMDLAGDPGFCFVRQGQLRYQYNVRPGHYFAASIENPDRGLVANADGPLFLNAGREQDKLPDFVVKYFYATKNLTISPRFLVRQFDLTDNATDQSDSAIGWGAALSSSLNVGPVKFYATFMYGDGLGRYGDLGNIGGAGLTANNEVETVGFMSVNGGATLKLSDTVSWTIGAGWAENDDDAYTGADAVLTGNATKNAVSYCTNVKWAVTPALEWAIGIGQYEREVMDGREGDMTRTQMYFKYSF